jgi:CPA2 family monovalent cation:H+ antiporter-2
MHSLPPIFFDVVFLLLAAIVVVPLLQSVRIPPVLGYLTAGILVGPYTPGPRVGMDMPQGLAEVGVMFLMFAIGLELPLSRLQAMHRFIFGLGLLQVVATSGLIGGVAAWLGMGPAAALVVGGTLALSSTATVLKLLVEKNEAVTVVGRVAVAVLIFQDLAVVPLLTLLPLLGEASGSLVAALIHATLKGAAAIAFIFLLDRLAVRPFYRFVAAARNPEVFTATNLFLVLTIGWFTSMAGMSMALGAFLAGLLLADSVYRHQIEADIEPFRGLLLGLFFMTVGMQLNLPVIAGHIPLIAGLTIALLATKAVLLFLLARLTGLPTETALRVGMLLSQCSEFSFVIVDKAAALGVLDTATGQIIASSVAIGMALTPALDLLGRRLTRRYESHRGQRLYGLPPSSDLADYVLVAGFGRVGQTIAHTLSHHKIPWMALDNDLHSVAQARKKGLPVFFGDASRATVLGAAGIARARAAIVTINHPPTATRTVEAIHDQAPELVIVARAYDLEQCHPLEIAGATAAVPEALETSLSMAGILLRAAGLDDDTITAGAAAMREERYAALAARHLMQS